MVTLVNPVPYSLHQGASSVARSIDVVDTGYRWHSSVRASITIGLRYRSSNARPAGTVALLSRKGLDVASGLCLPGTADHPNSVDCGRLRSAALLS